MHQRGEVFDEIIATIGAEAALRLALKLGGTSIRMGYSTWPALASAIGDEPARRLIERFSPDVLHLPRLARWREAHRNAELVECHAQGETQCNLALRFNLTERRIRQIIAAHRRAPESAGRTQA